MRATALGIPACALAAALVWSGCGGGDEAASTPQPSAAQKSPEARPAHKESLPAPQPARAQPAPPPAPESAPPPGDVERAPAIPSDAPLPEGERQLSRPPEDFPVPAGAKATTPMLMSDDGIAHGSYEMEGTASAAATSYTAGLLQKGWSIEPGRTSDSQALLSATKGDRQLSIAIESSNGHSQIVIFETQRPRS